MKKFNIRKAYAYREVPYGYGTFYWSGNYGCGVLVDIEEKDIEVLSPTMHNGDGKSFTANSPLYKEALEARAAIVKMFKPLTAKGWTIE